MKDLELDEIHLGDCKEYLGRVPDESVDLIVTSPPYNIGKEYESREPLDSYLEDQKEVIKECNRVLKETGSIFWQVGGYSKNGTLTPLDVKIFPLLEETGMLPRNRIVWVRQHGYNAKNKFSARHETVLWFTKSDDYKFYLDRVRVPQKYRNKKYSSGEKKGEYSCHPDGKNPGDVWAFRNVKHNHEEQTIHPCQFPEDMIARIVLACTDKEDVVLDPYVGAGTVPVVAKEYDRHFIGAEIKEKYYDVTCRRLSGEPDENNCFPNLKTLRDYVEQTGEPIEKFKYDRMKEGATPTERSEAIIHSEAHHLWEFERRRAYEEACFAAGLRGEEPPEDYFQGGKRKSSSSSSESSGSKKKTPSLFDEIDESKSHELSLDDISENDEGE